jgi:hypothetical protein
LPYLPVNFGYNCGVSIKEKAAEIKTLLTRGGWHTALLMASLSLASFALGHLSGAAQNMVPAPLVMRDERASSSTSGVDTPETINVQTSAGNESVEGTSTLREVAAETTGHAYVGSRKGTKYHLPWCPGAKAISEENKVWFQSKDEAEMKGYTPAANCKGI